MRQGGTQGAMEAVGVEFWHRHSPFVACAVELRPFAPRKQNQGQASVIQTSGGMEAKRNALFTAIEAGDEAGVRGLLAQDPRLVKQRNSEVCVLFPFHPACN